MLNQREQYIISAVSIPFLMMVLIGDYESAKVLVFVPIIIALFAIYADRIRANKKLMDFLEKVC